MPAPAAPAPYLLDCDTGVDDALALAWLVAHPGVDLVGVSCIFGNTNPAQAARNSCDLLALLGRPEVPVAVGPSSGLAGGGWLHVPYIHGENGIGDVALPRAAREPEPEESAAALIVRLARAHAGELRLVAIGPLTNLALALRLEPALPSLVHSVTIMGGAAMAPGNETPRTEANITNDAEAAAAVFTAGWDLTVVPLDATMLNVFDESHQQRLAASGHPAVRAIAGMLDVYFDFYQERVYGRRACAMHDPLAAAIATGDVVPALAPRVVATVDLSEGPEFGQTVFDLRGRYRGWPEPPEANARVVLEAGTGFAELLTERLVAL